ncbi:uncharacterized protein H6S33_009225 [Morchella sextelata]|uniref:uncharacterized protein n=1 Tax=Morchella sextelata TaxID=1174677 RepID=UPI001D04C395|nr:uncharacterized protein H6S33_009225 [Morchella sextelata]KAH0612845.1 hypothetical protein H6S33_009225 [Morchella sextelata]
MTTDPPHVDILLFGSGWISTFLAPLLTQLSLTHALTSRSGSPSTIPFTFDPTSTDPTPFTHLPPATTVLIIFPLRGAEATKTLVSLYTQTHPNTSPNFIQLGSTGIWTAPGRTTRHSPYDTTNARAIAEDALLALGGAVLNLAGLWGGERDPRNWVGRVAATKEMLRVKESLHVVHGVDVAWAVVSLLRRFTPGERWIVSDMRVYDWWDLASAWGSGGTGGEKKGEQMKWVLEMMEEGGVGALPRCGEGWRRLECADFWRMAGRGPLMRLDFSG